MHKLTATDISRILEMAKRIGPITTMVQRTLSGAEMLELGYVTWKGRPINPTARYMLEVIKEANVALVIMELCRRDGMEPFEQALRDMGKSTAKLLPTGALHLLNNTTNQPVNPSTRNQ